MVRRSRQSASFDGKDKVKAKLYKQSGSTDLAQLYIDIYGRKLWLPRREIIEASCDDDMKPNARIIELPYWLAEKCKLEHDLEDGD